MYLVMVTELVCRRIQICLYRPVEDETNQKQWKEKNFVQGREEQEKNSHNNRELDAVKLEVRYTASPFHSAMEKIHGKGEMAAVRSHSAHPAP